MYVPSVAQDISDAAPGVVFGLLIIAVMFVAPTGLAGLAGRARGAAARRLTRTTTRRRPHTRIRTPSAPPHRGSRTCRCRTRGRTARTEKE
ncbi:hypothetical protein [Streptomyces sp. F001]|uniref:hypothetical protein n=1 Tax=Streptomyces sp. F001 TaxID=1510026 RepID=UPI0019D22632|nr:hypothetical protein [Streptomyces sp. F001]